MRNAKRPQYVGIMQGRLVPPEPGRFQSFPASAWRDEFPNAAAAGLDAIEWIYDAYGAEKNPVCTDAGIDEMRALGKRCGVSVVSMCADYFMDFPIVRASDAERVELAHHLAWLIGRCRFAGIERIVIPFVDASRITSAKDERAALAFLAPLGPVAAAAGVEVHLETDLDPGAFARLLESCDPAAIFVNYDSGNSSSLGYRPREEFAAYGHRIGSVHIKDRLLGGGTVALGTGGADLPAVFEGLREAGYRRDYVLQAARGEAGDEVALAARNAGFVRDRMARIDEEAGIR